MPNETDYTYTVQIGKEAQIMETRKMKVPMFTVFRFGKTVGDTWGSSPIRESLPHIRVVNEAQLLFMTSAAYLSMGAWMVSSDTAVNYSNMRLNPGDVITVDSELKPVPFGGQLNITEATIQDHRTQIRRMLFNDVILPPEESKYQTATEIQTRQAEFYRRLGPYGLRLEAEFLKPVVGNLIIRLQQRGEVEDFVIDGEQFELVVNSAVKRGIALTEIQRDLQLLQIIQQLGPEAMANINTQKLARKVLRDGDFSVEAVRSVSEVEELLQQAQQQQQALQLQQVAQQIAGQQPNPNTPV